MEWPGARGGTRWSGGAGEGRKVARMFLGEHQHSLDDKGRVILPAKFRDQLAGAYVTSEVDGCLAVWPPAEFEVRAREMRERSRGGPADRQVARAFFSGTAEAPPDRQGRVAI